MAKEPVLSHSVQAKVEMYLHHDTEHTISSKIYIIIHIRVYISYMYNKYIKTFILIIMLPISSAKTHFPLKTSKNYLNFLS